MGCKFWGSGNWPSSLVPNPYQRFMVISTEESKKTYHKFTFRAKATSLSKKLDILRKERNVTCPSKETTKHPCSAVGYRNLYRPRRSNVSNWRHPFSILLSLPKWPISSHFHSSVFLVFPSILRSRCCMELKQLHWIGRHSEGCCFAWIKETTNVTLEGIPWLCPIANLGVILEVNRESSLRG